jgi:hypothetical protein
LIVIRIYGIKVFAKNKTEKKKFNIFASKYSRFSLKNIMHAKPIYISLHFLVILKKMILKL